MQAILSESDSARPDISRVQTTIQCHKHLILINNQQLSPNSNTTRFITIIQSSGKIIFDPPSSKSTRPMLVWHSHGKTKLYKANAGREGGSRPRRGLHSVVMGDCLSATGGPVSGAPLPPPW